MRWCKRCTRVSPLIQPPPRRDEQCRHAVLPLWPTSLPALCSSSHLQLAGKQATLYYMQGYHITQGLARPSAAATAAALRRRPPRAVARSAAAAAHTHRPERLLAVSVGQAAARGGRRLQADSQEAQQALQVPGCDLFHCRRAWKQGVCGCGGDGRSGGESGRLCALARQAGRRAGRQAGRPTAPASASCPGWPASPWSQPKACRNDAASRRQPHFTPTSAAGASSAAAR